MTIYLPAVLDPQQAGNTEGRAQIISRVVAWAPGRAALLKCGCSVMRDFTRRPVAVQHTCMKEDP